MELMPLFEATGSRSTRKIHRIPTKQNEFHAVSDQLPASGTMPCDSSNQPDEDPKSSSIEVEVEEASDSPNQPNQDPRSSTIKVEVGEASDSYDQPIEDPRSSTIKVEEASDSNNARPIRNMEESVPRFSFGPLYVVNNPSMIATKEKAWEHVLDKSSDADTLVTTETYTGAVSKVQTEAKETYAEELSITDYDFRWMMIKDGCLFLQLALSILGVSPERLGYTPNDPIFGAKEIKKDAKMWIESMFFMGNQIPLVVLKELMNQKFFQDVIKRVKWDPSPSTLCKKVLYELLVLPVVKKPSLIRRIRRRDDACVLDQSSDLLHGLENMVIGTERPGYLSNDEHGLLDDLDLEANYGEEDFDDICEPSVPGDNVDRLRVLFNAFGLTPGAIADQTRLFPSATDLMLTGIRIKKLNEGGIRRIHFGRFCFWAYLYLPPLLVDDHTETIFKNLKIYEIIQQPGKNNHHICSYLKLMSGIIQTTKDVKLLEKAGIIKRSPKTVKEKLPRILSRMSSDVKTLTHEFRTLRGQIRDYSSPMVHYKGIINVVVILTLLQFVVAVLAYVRPLHR